DICTKKEDAATKVERQVGKSAAALLLKSKIGERFEGMITGASENGTWVRLLDIPAEGMLKSGYKGIDVGDQVTVELVSVDVTQGFIDFKRVGNCAEGRQMNKSKMRAQKGTLPC
ncbi:MAG: hypothetical protein LUQ59_05725, partial [Methanothrix sp.]|nr:hypothetical protein [Methanothrix sp.]